MVIQANMKSLLAIFTLLTSTAMAADSLHEFKLKDIDGKELDLSTLKGKAVLVVNVASQCGYTGQYANLQRLHEQMKDQGVVVLGVPANNFGGQEPGTEAEIKAFCTTDYGVTFPMLSKLSATGGDQAPLFAFLTSSNPELTGQIGWNFEKFLISKDGKVVSRFGSGVEPDSDEVIASIKEVLAR
jgi:glutathione peroxidase